MKARKSYGQHFLNKPEVAQTTASYVKDYENIDCIVEVGPGMGALTRYLVQYPMPLLAIEADKNLIPFLYNNFNNHSNLKIVHADYLKFDVRSVYPEKSFALVGNFPYNISSQIVMSLIEYRLHCPVLIGMFQKELADRVIAPPGSKTYGAISALIQFYYEGHKKFNLDPGSFNPPPKVKSSVIVLERRTSFPKVEYKSYRRLVKMAFGQRRKKIRNTIGHLFHQDLVAENGYFQQRPEQLGVEDFVELVKLLNE